MATVNDRIRERRKALGMSQEELSRKVGYLNRSAITLIENNKRAVMIDKLPLFAKALNTTPLYLLGREPYYNDQEVDVLAETLKEREELKILFDATKDASKEDIMFVVSMLERLKK